MGILNTRDVGGKLVSSMTDTPATSFFFFFFFFFCVPQLYLRGSPYLGEIFAHVTVF